MSRRTVSSCVLCAFALAPASLASEIPGGTTGGAVAPTPVPQAPALAPTPAEAVQRPPATRAPVAQAPAAPTPAVAVRPPPPTAPAGTPQATAAQISAAPRLRPTSAVTAQNDDDVVEVPVPRRRRRSTPAPAPAPVPAAPVAQAPRLPMTGFDLGLFTAAGLIVLGTGVGLSAAVGPAPRRR